jgi:hypothetical protein
MKLYYTYTEITTYGDKCPYNRKCDIGDDDCIDCRYNEYDSWLYASKPLGTFYIICKHPILSQKIKVLKKLLSNY